MIDIHRMPMINTQRAVVTRSPATARTDHVPPRLSSFVRYRHESRADSPASSVGTRGA